MAPRNLINLESVSLTFGTHVAGDTAKHEWAGDGLTAGQMLERFGFAAQRQWTPAGDLSGGERRRLQLLRLLMAEPNVLLVDEPSTPIGRMDRTPSYHRCRSLRSRTCRCFATRRCGRAASRSCRVVSAGGR